MKKLFIIALLFLITACKTTTKTITEYRDRDVYHEVVKYDSIFKHDSIFAYMYMRGDTVFVGKNTIQTEFRNLYIHDSTIIRDTTFIDKEVIKEKKVTRLFSWFDWILLALGVGAFVLWLRFSR